MRIHCRVRNLTAPEKEQFESYLEKKLEPLKSLVKAHHPHEDSVHVFAKIQKHPKHTAFAYECVLDMPRKRIVSSEVKHSITEALDFTTDRLAKGLVKHFKKRTRK